jgi:HK97 gp10 family phage protein
VSNGFELAGFDELMARLREMGDEGKQIEEKALNKAAPIMRDAIESGTPESNLPKEHAKNFIVVGEVKDGIIPIGPDEKHYYLRFPEFGTSKQPGQGFIEKAFNDTKEEAKQAIAEAIREELNL